MIQDFKMYLSTQKVIHQKKSLLREVSPTDLVKFQID